jgi:hypothetical protein
LKSSATNLPPEKVEIGIGYTSRKYRRRPTDLDGKLGIVIAGSAPSWRNGVILAQENESWTVSVAGFLGDDAPDNDEGFLAYLATLPTMEIHDVVAKPEPLTDYNRYATSLACVGGTKNSRSFPRTTWFSATPSAASTPSMRRVWAHLAALGW